MSEISTRDAGANAPQSERLWTPSPARAAASQMHAFMHAMAAKHGVTADWESLWRWSIERRDLFWAEFLAFAEVELSTPASATFAGEGMLGTKWFPGARLNYAQHMLRHDGNEDAIVFEGELRQSRRISREKIAKYKRRRYDAVVFLGE